VLHRRLLIPLALAGSVGIGLAPAIAEAATPSSASGAAQQIKSQSATNAAAVAKAAGFKTYHSPAAAKSIRLQKSVAADATGHAAARAATATASGTTIYTTTADFSCTSGTDTGTGTAANPYCDPQDAFNAASPGDTIDVAGATGYSWDEPVSITTSDLTIVGTSTQSWFGEGLTLDGVSNVTISNIMVERGTADVAIEGSTGVVLDSDYLGGVAGAADGVSIDGSSSDITISRTFVNAAQDAVAIASGASGITLAGDLIATSAISATGVSGLDITGDTIQRGCYSGVDIEGASTGVYLENNVFEDSEEVLAGGTDEATCLQNAPKTWQPDVTVASAASGSVTSDYNDFDVASGDTTDPYSWAGTAYPGTSAFTTATGQGSHDTNDTSTYGEVYLRANESDNILATPTNQSPAVGSANLSAPGELSSDFYGVTPYNTRGAVQFTGPNPDLDLEADATDSSAYGVTVDFSLGGFDSGTVDVTAYWGDNGQSGVGATTASGELQHSYTDLGTYTVTLIANDGQGDSAETTISDVQTAGSEYTPYGPTRILDTRKGLGAPEAAVGTDKTVKLQVTGAGTAGDTIPAGITAVALNVTVVSPTKNGYLTVWGDQDETGATVPQPGTSNLNFSPGQTVPNLVIVPVGVNGVVDIYNGSKGSSQLLADVAGYFTEANTGRYVALTPNPSRLLDTRKGTGTGGKVAKIPAGGNLTLTVAGAGGIPSSDVTAVSLNLTAVDSTANGVITAYPAGQSLPVVSNVNYPAGKTIANMSIVPLGTGGKIVLHNNGGAPVDLLADAFGYYTPDDVASSSAYVPLTQPQRLLDTRQPGEGGALLAGDTYYWEFTTLADLTAGVFNATVVSPTGNGYLAVYPFQPGNPLAVPGTSNLNYRAGQTVPNLVFGTPGGYDSGNQTYDLGLYLGGNGDAQLLLDLFGFFEDA
jgi:hypothetical protein